MREREGKERAINILKNFDKLEIKLKDEYERKIRDLEMKLANMYFFYLGER